MAKKIKKLFFVVLSIAALFAVFTVVASAETHEYNGKEYEIQTEGDYSYFIVTDENALTDWDKEHSGTGAFLYKYNGTAASVAIPATLGGQPVIEIYSSAFYENTALQTLTIGESVNLIAGSSFKNCTGLQTVLIAKNVESIDGDAFSGCTALKSVTFQKGSVLVNIGSNALYNCTSLINFTIPDTVEFIGEFAFANCDSITDISIPSAVTEIGVGVFFSCDSLVNASVGDGITSLPTYNGYYNMTSYPDWGTTSNRCGFFEGCVSLESITIGCSVQLIGQDCFAGTALVDIVIPDNVITVDAGAFYNCNSLVKVVIGDGVTSLGQSVFRSCDSLSEVSIGSGVISIGDYAFRDSTELTSIIIPSNVTTLGVAVFYHCTALETVVIGNGVTALSSDGTSIGYISGAFEECTSLKSVTIGSAVQTIGPECFAGTALVNVTIPDNVKDLGDRAFYSCKSLERIDIGNGVTYIGSRAFAFNSSLTNIKIGTGVISIGDFAFENCDSLVFIQIPSNVTSMGNGCFWSCDKLESAIVGNGITSLATYKNYYNMTTYPNWGYMNDRCGCFEGCINLKEVTLGSGIISIGTDTFAGTQITTLTVPGKVSTLSSGAFAGATELKDIYFTGNWPASVGDSLFDNIAEGYTVHYINGKIGYNDLSYNKAVFTPVTVTFDNNDDNVFCVPTESQILAPVGGYVIEPIVPTAFGYLFAGWYKDSACTMKWNFATDNVTSDVTLYAKWNSVNDVIPVRPENLSTSGQTGNSITLSWSAVDGAKSYNIYVDNVLEAKDITEISYAVLNLNPSTTYEFEVSAVNSKGESVRSLIVADRTTNHVHEYGEWTVTRNATCATDGEKTRTCECGITESEAIPATGEHEFGEWVVVKAATADEEGSMERICKVCGEIETQVIDKITAKKGDINADGNVTAADARIALRISANLQTATAEQKIVADTNGDGKITAADARKILRVSAGLEKI